MWWMCCILAGPHQAIVSVWFIPFQVIIVQREDTQFLTNTWVFHQSVLVYSERKYSSLQLCTTLPKAASKGPPRRRLPAAWRGFPGRPSGVTRRDTSWHVTWHVVTVCDWHFNAGTGKSWKIHGCFTSFHYVWASEVQRIKCQNTNKQYEDNAK